MGRGLLQRAYAALPAPLQNLVFSLLGLKLRRQRYGRGFRERLAWLRESEWCTRAQIAEYQRTQLGTLVRHCHETVPYYRELFDRLRLTPDDIREPADLHKLPLLTKEALRQNRDRLVSRAFDRRRLMRVLTSGTTGAPLELLYSRAALQFQWAVWWRHRARFGLRLGDPFLMFGARQPVPITQERPPFWRKNYAFNQTYLSTYHLTPKYMPEIVRWLNGADFDFYTGYPSAMVVLANFIRDAELRLTNRPKYVVSGSDALLPAFERLLREVFGVPVTDQYGAAECCANLARCEHGVYHEDYEFGIIEALENPADPGGARKIVGTGFANYALPLLRYDTGDVGVFSDEPCPCGRQSRVVLRIDGRTEDYVRTPDGRMAVGMNQVFEWVPGAREMQIVQNELERIVVRIVKRDTWGASDEKALLRELRSRLGDAIAIEFQFVAEIPRTASGKFRAVISTLGKTGSAAERELQSAIENAPGAV